MSLQFFLFFFFKLDYFCSAVFKRHQTNQIIIIIFKTKKKTKEEKKKLKRNFLLNEIYLNYINQIIYGAIPNKQTKQCILSFSYLTVIEPSVLGFHKQVELK